MVRNMLHSILGANEHHEHWELVFGDDGSKTPGRPIVEDILEDHLGKVTFVHSGMNFEDKIEQGLILGRLANEAIAKSDADVALILCDDDELVPTYLKELSEFFTRHQNILYCYSKIHLYNPLFQKSENVNNVDRSNRWNKWDTKIEPSGKVDATQVAWRLDCCKKYGAWFDDSTKSVQGKPWTKNTDKSFFENLYDKCGECHPSGLVAQFKGVHDYQLLWHKNVPPAQLETYDNMCKELEGVEF